MKQIHFYMFLLVGILIINMWDVVGFWLEGKRSEYYVHILSGATTGGILRLFLGEYFVLLLVAFGVATGIAGILHQMTLVFSPYLFKCVTYFFPFMILSALLPVGIVLLRLAVRMKGYGIVK